MNKTSSAIDAVLLSILVASAPIRIFADPGESRLYAAYLAGLELERKAVTNHSVRRTSQLQPQKPLPAEQRRRYEKFRSEVRYLRENHRLSQYNNEPSVSTK